MLCDGDEDLKLAECETKWTLIHDLSIKLFTHNDITRFTG